MTDATTSTPGGEFHCKFDLWRNDRWIGMIYGKDPEHARRLVAHYFPNVDAESLLLIPFYGTGTSQRTYQALTGRRSQMPDAEHQEYKISQHIDAGEFSLVSL